MINFRPILGAALFFLIFSANAATTWTFTSGGKTITCGNIGTDTSLQSKALNFGTIRVPATAAVGAVLASVVLPAYAMTVGCDNNYYNSADKFAIVVDYNYFTASSYGNGVYDTNIPGIGIRFKHKQIGNIPWSEVRPSAKTSLNLPLTAELVKTAATTASGTLTSGNVLNVSFGLATIGVAALSGTQIVSPACEITTAKIAVNLGTLHKNLFSGIGSTAGKQAFSIPLKCNAGTNVVLKFEAGAAGSPDLTKGLLNLNKTDDAAQGVGIQLQYKDAPLVLSSNINPGSIVNDGVVDIPFSAQIYQTASTIVAGSIDSSATFTMTYD